MKKATVENGVIECVDLLFEAGDAYNWAAYYISKVFATLGVNSINDIKKGKPIRAIIWDHLCIGIQDFMDRTNYYIPREDWPENMKDIDLSEVK